MQLSCIWKNLWVFLVFGFAWLPGASAQEKFQTLNVDYATYNPLSLVVKEKGYLEEQLKSKGIRVKWIKSEGSNQAIENIYSNVLNIGSTAGSASLAGRMRGIKISAVGVFAKPEWTAMVTLSGRGIHAPKDLIGKRVAVTRGTDPHAFLLRAFAAEGIPLERVRLHYVQHRAGLKALKSGIVDAWIGLDPFIAQAEAQDKAEVFYRNPGLNTIGVIVARDEFLQNHPFIAGEMNTAYAKARTYAQEHPEEYLQILSRYAQLDVALLGRVLKRTNIADHQLRKADVQGLIETGVVLQHQGVVPGTGNVKAEVDAFFARLAMSGVMQ